MVAWLGSILAIFLVDLVLSGDNAVVIGVAASGLPRDQRMTAIIIGGGGAIILRIVFALAATFLLQLRFIGIIGSIILLFIAIRLLIERSNERRTEHAERAESVAATQSRSGEKDSQIQKEIPAKKKRARKSLFISITTILLADVTMSLDNVLAVGGLAAGDVLPLIIGLVFSIFFLLVGSALVAEFISRLPWLLDLACLVVAWTAAQIFLGDDSLNALFERFTWISFVVPAITLLLVLITDIVLYRGDRQQISHSS